MESDHINSIIGFIQVAVFCLLQQNLHYSIEECLCPFLYSLVESTACLEIFRFLNSYRKISIQSKFL